MAGVEQDVGVVQRRQVLADPSGSGAQRGVGLLGRRMGDDDVQAAGQRLGVVPRVGRAQPGAGAAGQLGEVRVGVQPEAGDEHAAVGIGLHDERLTPLPGPHRAEGEDGRRHAGGRTVGAERDECHG